MVTRMAARAATVLVAVLAMSGCGGGSLEEDDPRGAEACAALVESIRYEGDVEQQLGQMIIAGKAAAKAKSDAIAGTVGEPIEGLDMPVVDGQELYDACEEEGVEMPRSERFE